MFFIKFFCKENANERNESLLSNCRVLLFFCKDNTFFGCLFKNGGNLLSKAVQNDKKQCCKLLIMCGIRKPRFLHLKMNN